MWFRRRPLPDSFQKAPFNPLSGHVFMCKCGPCDRFWRSDLGSLIYGKWHQHLLDLYPRTKYQTTIREVEYAQADRLAKPSSGRPGSVQPEAQGY
jgi:hypothetical protein